MPRFESIGKRRLGPPQGRRDDPPRQRAIDRGIECEDLPRELVDADGRPVVAHALQ
jgi:hypothetical protein